MDPALRQRVESFIQPLSQDLDGISRVGDILRLEEIARRLYRPESAEDEHHFTLLVLFSRLEKWLGRMGSISRAALAIGTGVSESDLRRVHESLGHLERPRTPAERAVASAQLIDAAGIGGLATRLAAARREGLTAREVAEEELGSPVPLPDWLDVSARDWIEGRDRARREVCHRLMDELTLEDHRPLVVE